MLAPDGTMIASIPAETHQIEAGAEISLELTTKVEVPQKWSAEIPVLYAVQLILSDHQKNDIETTQIKFGFRKVEIKGKQILINGHNIVFRGVNRHECHPVVGQSIDKAQMEADVI